MAMPRLVDSSARGLFDRENLVSQDWRGSASPMALHVVPQSCDSRFHGFCGTEVVRASRRSSKPQAAEIPKP